MTQQEAEALLGFQVGPGWTFHALCRGEAFVMVKGSEIHGFRLDQHKGRWLTRTVFRDLLEPLRRQYGFLTTKVRKDNRTGQRFVARIGFEPCGEDERCIYYVARSLKHA
jgi:ribosomal protein S18 acetylase RimI-like enzyme